jgi:hypothetical protein
MREEGSVAWEHSSRTTVPKRRSGRPPATEAAALATAGAPALTHEATTTSAVARASVEAASSASAYASRASRASRTARPRFRERALGLPPPVRGAFSSRARACARSRAAAATRGSAATAASRVAPRSPGRTAAGGPTRIAFRPNDSTPANRLSAATLDAAAASTGRPSAAKHCMATHAVVVLPVPGGPWTRVTRAAWGVCELGRR